MKDNQIALKTHAFARRMVKAYQYLLEKKEAEFAQSKADFINKMSIALKEANETRYWLDLLHYGDYLEDDIYMSLDKDIKEIISILVAIVKSTKYNQ